VIDGASPDEATGERRGGQWGSGRR
jgi:hypothetical protein